MGSVIGGIFCVTLIISTITGGNMFQSWNVALLTQSYFGVPKIATGIILALVVGMVIIGGIRRIGTVAGKLVPLMCLLYLLAGLAVLVVKAGEIPATFALIFQSAFAPLESQGAFVGGTLGFAFMVGGTGMEVSLPKILGAMLMFFIVWSLMAKFALPIAIGWLDRRGNALPGRAAG